MKKILLPFMMIASISTICIGQEAKEKTTKEATGNEETKEEDVPPHWHFAEHGYELFENKNYPEAQDSLKEALKYIDEFADEDKAKVNYQYAKCIQKTHIGDADFLYTVKIYKAYSEAAKYGSGWYQKECEIEMGDSKDGMNRRFVDELDRAEAGELSEEEMNLMIWAAGLLGYEEEKNQLTIWKAWIKNK